MGDVICIYHVQFYTVGFTIILVFRVGPAYCVRNGKVPFPFKEGYLIPKGTTPKSRRLFFGCY